MPIPIILMGLSNKGNLQVQLRVSGEKYLEKLIGFDII